MRKNICLLLAMIISAGPLAPMSFGYNNPLKSYNLYEDVHKNDYQNPERETVMGEMFYSQNGYSTGKKTNTSKRKNPPSQNPTTDKGLNDSIENIKVEVPQRRNDYLRESAKKRYATSGSARWEEGEPFYENPDLESIKQKYREKNYAGCMQECEAYVRLHPNDTLGFYYLAMCYANSDDKENAVRAYEKVISLNEHPMMVKYATNGRNCLIKEKMEAENNNDSEEIKCFENVNEPEYVYPYKELAKTIDMTPVDPQTLINKNIEALQEKLVPPELPSKDNQGKKNTDLQINLPFGKQDSTLDEFIKAPYGSGMSPELEKQYKQIQLREFQQKLNHGDDVNNDIDKDKQNNNNKKSSSETIKLAMADNNELQDFFNSPEYIQSKKELDQINMMFGDYKSEKGNELMDIIPALSQGNDKLSPQAMQMLMMQSVMPDIINISGNNTF